jgi:hypothetical protein
MNELLLGGKVGNHELHPKFLIILQLSTNSFESPLQIGAHLGSEVTGRTRDSGASLTKSWLNQFHDLLNSADKAITGSETSIKIQ